MPVRPKTVIAAPGGRSAPVAWKLAKFAGSTCTKGGVGLFRTHISRYSTVKNPRGSSRGGPVVPGDDRLLAGRHHRVGVRRRGGRRPGRRRGERERLGLGRGRPHDR